MPDEQRITAWSYSRLQVYQQCPLKAKFKFIDRVPEPGSPAMDRGAAIHKEAENYLKGLLPKLPVSLNLFAEQFQEVKNLMPLGIVDVELEKAYDVDWKSTSWFDKAAWLRVKMDLVYVEAGSVMYIIDHKTGKGNPESQKSQLELYALSGFLDRAQSGVETVIAEFWYLDQGVTVKEEFKVSQLAALKKKWKAEVRPMLKDKTFASRPNSKCCWCHYSKSKAGLCDY